MSSRIERFKKRQQIKKQTESQPLSSMAGLVDQSDIDEMLSEDLDVSRVENLKYATNITCSFEADPHEVKSLIEGLRQAFNHERFEQLMVDTRRDVVFAISGPFGLGKVLAAYDKNGGNVTTVNNAQQGVYADSDDKYVRKDYDSAKNSQGQQFSGAGKNSVGANSTRSKMDSRGMVKDEFTGREESASTTSPDHIFSLSDFHRNGGFMLDKREKADFATDVDNLAQTNRSINQSMQDTDKETWMSKSATKDNSVTNAEYFDVDVKAVRKAVQLGEKAANKHLPSNTEKLKYYATNSARTGMNEGLSMGFQQAVGLMVVEFFSQVFHETSAVFKQGLEGDGLIDDLRIRFTRIAKSVSAKWKDVAKAFSGGFFAGFMSNLVTVAINMVKTTSAKVVRLIREGIFSLLKALKLVLFKPKNLTRAQAMHEAMKIIFAGGVVVAGVLLESAVAAMLSTIPVFMPFAPIMTAAIVGALTALAMALVTYLLDRLDLFNAIEVERNTFIIGRMDEDIQASLARSEAICEEMDQYLLPV